MLGINHDYPNGDVRGIIQVMIFSPHKYDPVVVVACRVGDIYTNPAQPLLHTAQYCSRTHEAGGKVNCRGT